MVNRHALCIALFAFFATRAFSQAVPSLSQPALSPDGAEIAFVSSGDIWSVPSAGGEARLLIAHGANESRPLYSPDGKRLAFISDRSGNGDIYILEFETGKVRRLTFSDSPEHLDGWSRDNKHIYFSTTSYDIGSGAQDIYRVAVDGGTPMPVAHEPYFNEFFAAPHPKGAGVAYCAGGMADRTWWRKGRNHGDECEIQLLSDGQVTPSIQKLTPGGARDLWPMWSPDGGLLYYISDRSGTLNLHVKTAGGQHKQLTQFKDGRVHWPVISNDGGKIVFERGSAIWIYDTADKEAKELSIKLRGVSTISSPDHHSFSSFDELALSPDGKKIALVTHGEIFAASAKEDSAATRVTRSAAVESHVTWSRDSRKLAYVSNRDGKRRIYLYDFFTGQEIRLTNGEDDTRPRFAPDATSLIYQHDGREIRLIELFAKKERTLVSNQTFEKAPFDRQASAFIISPGADWVAYAAPGPKGFENVYVVPTSGRDQPRQVTFLANAGSNSLSWSPSGNFLLFGTGQRTEDYQLARVDLIPRTPKFREDQFKDLFRESRPFPRPTKSDSGEEPSDGDQGPTTTATKPSTRPAGQPATIPAPYFRPAEPAVIIFDDIRRRTRLLNPGFDIDFHAISPDGRTALLIGTSVSQANLYLYPLEETAREAVAKQLTSTPLPKGFAQFSPDGKDVYFLEQGKVTVVNLETRAPRTLAIVAEMDAEFEADKLQVFNQAWTYLRDHFYDAKFNGADWPAVKEQYAPRVAGARTEEEFRRVLLLMVGELDASHLNIVGPAVTRAVAGRLGVRFDCAAYDKEGALRVAQVFPLSPAAIAGVNVGDYLLNLDGQALSRQASLDRLLVQKIGKRVNLKVATDAAGNGARDVSLQAIDGATERGLSYRAWVESRRKYVEKASKGSLGYVHLPDMTETALARLNADLDSDNQGRAGVIVDVRNNRGGFVNGFAIDIFSRKNYLTMIRRGFQPVPRVRLGQRSLDVPTALVANRGTYSDGEDFTEAFTALKLGKIIGEPTAGSVIFTSVVALLDGTRMGLPHTKVLGVDGQSLEGHPRKVDIEVERTPGESYADKDAQLDAAIESLLGTIAAGKSP